MSDSDREAEWLLVLNMKRTTPHNPILFLKAVAGQCGNLNSKPFRGYAAGTLMFREMSGREDGGVVYADVRFSRPTWDAFTMYQMGGGCDFDEMLDGWELIECE